tara:strand:+ start:45 stop:275 length:231 start_codon:yes stop_codon:yes gene_type:complete
MPRVTRTQRSARAAYRKAADLAPLKPVEPGGRGVDGSPRLGPDQVYATKAGMVFHHLVGRNGGRFWKTSKGIESVS